MSLRQDGESLPLSKFKRRLQHRQHREVFRAASCLLGDNQLRERQNLDLKSSDFHLLGLAGEVLPMTTR